jgi:phosphinothricin acetyltransferase
MATIRTANYEDITAMLEISNAEAKHSPANFSVEPETIDSWQVTFKSTQPRFPNLVAIDENQIIGFTKSIPWSGRCAYEHSAQISIYISPTFQGKGIGKKLYVQLFPLLEEASFHTLIAGITLPNEASVRLHESMGMKHCGTFPEVGWKFNTWHDVGYWVKILTL